MNGEVHRAHGELHYNPSRVRDAQDLVERFGYVDNGSEPGTMFALRLRTYHDDIHFTDSSDLDNQVEYQEGLRAICVDPTTDRATIVDIDSMPTKFRPGHMRSYVIDDVHSNRPRVVHAGQEGFRTRALMGLRCPEGGYIKIVSRFEKPALIDTAPVSGEDAISPDQWIELTTVPTVERTLKGYYGSEQQMAA